MSEKLHSVWPILALDGVGDAIGDPRPAFVVSRDGRLLHFANAAGARFLGLPPARALDCRVSLEPRLAERLLRFAATARSGDTTRELMRYFDGLRSTLLSVALGRPQGDVDAILVVVDNARTDPADADPAASLAAIAAEGGLVALFDGEGDVVVALGDHAALDGVQDDIEAALDADDGAVFEHRVQAGARAHDVALVRLGSAPRPRRLLRVGPGVAVAATAAPVVEAPTPIETTPVDAPPVPAVETPADALAAAHPHETLSTSMIEASPHESLPTSTTEASPRTEPEAAPAAPVPPPIVAAPEAPAPLASVSDAAPRFDAEPTEPPAEAVIDVPAEAATEKLVETTQASVAPAAPEIPEPAVPPTARRPIDAGEDLARAIAVVTEATSVTEGEATPAPITPAPDASTPVAASTQDAAPAVALVAPGDAPIAETETDTETASDDGFRWRSPGRAVKFVWQMDAERRFTLISEELAAVVGPHAAALIGRGWRDVAADLGLDPEGRVAAALDRRDTWSGRTVLWPVEGEALRLPVDLAALPAFDRGRVFTGFRGFGTIRGDAAIPDPTAVGLRLAAPRTAATSADAAAALPSPFAILDAATPPAIPGDTEVALVEAAHPRPIEPTLDGGEAAFAGEIAEPPETADRSAEFSAGMAPGAEKDWPEEDWPEDGLALAMAALPPCRDDDDDDGFAATTDDEAPAIAEPDETSREPASLLADTANGADAPVDPDATLAETIENHPTPAAPPVAPVSPLALVAAEAAPIASAPSPAPIEAPASIENEALPAPTALAAKDGDADIEATAEPETPVDDDLAPEEIHEAATIPAPVATSAVSSTPVVTPAPTEPEPAAPMVGKSAVEIAALAAATRPPAEAERLSPPERVAFRQIAEVLGAHGDATAEPAPVATPASPPAEPAVASDLAEPDAPTETDVAEPAAPTPVSPEAMARIAALIHAEDEAHSSGATPATAVEAPKAPTGSDDLAANADAAIDFAPTVEAGADLTPAVETPTGLTADAASPNLVPPAALAAVTAPTTGVREIETRLLDRLASPVAVIRDDSVAYANDAFLRLLGYPDTATLEAEGGLDALFAGEHVARRWEPAADGSRPVPMLARDGRVIPVDATVATVPWAGGSALMLNLTEVAAAPVADAGAADLPLPDALPTALAAVPPGVASPAASLTTDFTDTTARERIAELEAIIDTATDGVLMLDAEGTILSANHAAEALFGVDRADMVGRPLTDRLAPESRRSAMDYLDGLARNGVASVLNDGREVIGAVDRGGLIPLFMTIGRISAAPSRKYCAVLRDITHWKKSEEDLTAARRRAEEASVHKSDFLAKISHEIRTPLNAIIGFSEVMIDERFGPVGNDRYKDYLRDIHTSGSHIMSLINDLLDLSKVEAGKMDLRFEAVALGDIMAECVAMMQPQANRERIIIRSSLPTGVPAVVADPRSVRQVALNLLSNAIKFTPSGGQVIVSTTLEDSGEVVMRVRDTGYGMTDKELQTAMEPFRQLHTTRSRGGGTGLGLPLTKALVEANRAVFRIDSTVGQGTLVTVTFPVTRVLAS